MLEQSRVKLARVLCVLLISLSGCDIVQGLRDANDAIFPSEKTYLDAPGFRLAVGGYRSLDFASGSSLYLLARSADAQDTALYSLLYADPKPCPIPAHGAYQGARGTFTATTIIVYTEEGTSQGTLRFANADCHVYDLSAPASGLPVVETSQGFVAQQGSNLILLNPVDGTQRTLAANAGYVGRFDVFNLAYSDGKLGAFDGELKEVGWFGDGVLRIGSVGSAFFFEDKNGIHRLDSTGGTSPAIVETVVAADGCSLAVPRYMGAPQSWVTYYAPCASNTLVAYAASSRQLSQLGFVTTPRNLAILPVWPTRGGDPAVDPYVFLFLRDVDDKTGLGTLFLRTLAHEEKVLGQKAPLDRAVMVSKEGDTHGVALVDVNGDTGRMIRWEVDGTTTEVATNIVRGSGDLLVRAADNSNDFALPTDVGITTVAHRLAPGGYRQRDPKDRWSFVLHEYDGASATLSVTNSRLDFVEATTTPTTPPVLESIATGVLPDWHVQFISSVPGLAYFTHDDPVNNVGRLEYRNLELRFTAQVSEGVSDYMSTDDGLIYSVPFGDGAGIWFTRSR